ncbi:uncharacterized protein LOC113564139 [Drosophila erecta]|uniref:Uncharacterized protein n=1 Tax=Drosophila melanogaster TaxID=7227 RepID=X2JDL1_DROME|nr:uncharacterized protein Dmel_CG45307 [Drosophila melanogaster]XP_026835285.1 uncharacterized protein LOC113564139 [Drosophila erecta]AHN54275.1 uncharacterized protein Dmel_CG45307 [Drosophila melanogaster]|eukprot:NP_001285761.1 uncharacterized protein Dmel_CG45307 [Drosophila melanogaster]
MSHKPAQDILQGHLRLSSGRKSFEVG